MVTFTITCLAYTSFGGNLSTVIFGELTTL